jgi:predicted ferric reductase
MSSLRAERPAASARNIWDYAGALALTGAALMIGIIVLSFAATGISISPVIWYLARAAGMTTYVLLWLSVVTGLGLTTRLLGFIGDQGIVLQAHRLATDLALAGTALHVLAIAVDPTVPIGMLGALVPFVSSVRQPWTDLGILAAYGMAGITLSFAARRWIGRESWRMLHYLTFGFWLLALTHAAGAGTDSSRLWAASMYAGSAASVVFLLTFRILHAWGKARAPRERNVAARHAQTSS